MKPAAKGVSIILTGKGCHDCSQSIRRCNKGQRVSWSYSEQRVSASSYCQQRWICSYLEHLLSSKGCHGCSCNPSKGCQHHTCQRVSWSYSEHLSKQQRESSWFYSEQTLKDVNGLSPTAFVEAGNGVMMVVPMQ